MPTNPTRLPHYERMLLVLWEHCMTGCAIVAGPDHPEYDDGTFLAVNKKWCEMLEYAPSELVHKRTWHSITMPDDVKGDQAMVEAVVSGESTSYDMWKTYIKKDGLPLRAQLHVQEVKDDDGKFAYFLSQIQPVYSVTGKQNEHVQIEMSMVATRFLVDLFKNNPKTVIGLISAATAVMTAVAGAIASLVGNSGG